MGLMKLTIETLDKEGIVIEKSEAFMTVPSKESGTVVKYLLTIDDNVYWVDKNGKIKDTNRFGLTKKQDVEIELWKSHIKEVFGECGKFSYTFSPTEIGSCLTVHSFIANISKDFTDLDSW